VKAVPDATFTKMPELDAVLCKKGEDVVAKTR